MRRRLQLTVAALCAGCVVAHARPAEPRVCETACVVPAPVDAGAPDRCPTTVDDARLEQALRGDAGEVWLDACRVVRKLPSSADSRCALLVAGSRPVYLEERGGDFIRECIASPDGRFEREHFQREGDGGWQLRVATFAGVDGGAAVRVTSTPLRWGQRREVRESWRDGGWQLDRDAIESKPRVLP